MTVYEALFSGVENLKPEFLCCNGLKKMGLAIT